MLVIDMLVISDEFLAKVNKAIYEPTQKRVSEIRGNWQAKGVAYRLLPTVTTKTLLEAQVFTWFGRLREQLMQTCSQFWP